MPVIKKKDLNKFKSSPKKDLEELVDVDGSPIEGDRNPTNNSEIETAPQQTTDDFRNQATQPNRNVNGYAGTGYNTRRVGEAKIETILNKILENQINTNEIPDIKELSNSKPIVVNKAQEIINTIDKNNLDGMEISIMLSYILSNVDMSKIPQNFREILKSKL